jgi:hypothetical protein
VNPAHSVADRTRAGHAPPTRHPNPMTTTTLHPEHLEHAEHTDITWQLLPAVDAAADAGRAAHRAATDLTNTLTACQMLPADIYQYAPDLFHATTTLTAAGRTLTSAVHTATAERTLEHVHAVYQATNALLHATAAVDVATTAVRNIAAWYTAALPAGCPN